ncbi:MAG: metallophosphoesterase family protein [Gemmataceae bacterium]
MKRIVIGVVALTLALGAVALSQFQSEPDVTKDLKIKVESRNPWTHLRLNNKSENFQFVIVSDRTGGHRPRIFSQAVAQINLLQPEFVLSVGDLIEGYTEDKEQIDKEWKEFQKYVSQLKMPFFYVPGNHDYTNKVMTQEWKERFGRSYFHFLYKDVLFLMLNSDDPPEKRGHISAEQVKFAEKVLKDNTDVRWTIVAIHKPLWNYGNVKTNNWLKIEKALGTRKYTVFAGHRHHYYKFQRNGRNFYQLATTGGGSRLRGTKYGEFDHIVWVTMRNSGPVLANIMLDGIYPENLKNKVTTEEGYRYERLKTYPVTGKIYYRGTPAVNAEINLRALEKMPGYVRPTARVKADGSFQLTTYTLNDGAPKGKYAVSISRQYPYWDKEGNVNPNGLPAKYASTRTSGLTVEITDDGPNTFMFELNDSPATPKDTAPKKSKKK